ncbi:MAG: hypothetical protein KGM47_17080, partial [Acidobacteriota bacterium]|nr:hypothetical protein [Acidobacteriota bacterium]
VTLAELEGLAARAGVREAMIPLEDLLPDCPQFIVRGREEADVRHGHSFELGQALRPNRGGRPGSSPAMSVLKIMNGERRLIAIARRVSGNVYHPDLVVA